MGHSFLQLTFSLYIKVAFCFLFFLTCISCTDAGSPVKPTDKTLPRGVSRHHLGNGMTIDVFVPGNYDQSGDYPLLILNDGEQMFSPGWEMQEVLQELIDANEIKPLVAVAIHTSGKRNDWYIPYNDPWIIQNWGPYSPQAVQYAQRIFEELIPFLESNYSISNTETGILGFSLGGLVSTWMGLKYPDKIKYSASLSGSFWVADYQIFDEADQKYENGQKFWFDIGTDEWNYYVPLYSKLDKAGAAPGTHSFYYEVYDANHTTMDWLNRIDMPLKMFFGTGENPTAESMEIILECIPSQSTPGKKFRRMNPIITLSNEVKYSLAHAADYTVTSGEAELGTEGSFRNNPDTEVMITVTYNAFSQDVTIPEGWCQ